MFALYLVTDPSLEGDLGARVASALEGVGPHARHVAVQLRAKQWPAGTLTELGHALRAITEAHGVALFVNDRADVARACRADGVHLPEAGMGVADARRRLPANALVGRSCHDRAGLALAETAGADFATLGPIHAVPDKGIPLGPEGFAACIKGARLPVLALGGVGIGDLPRLRQRGAAGVATIRGVLGAPDPKAAMAGWLAAWFGTEQDAPRQR